MLYPPRALVLSVLSVVSWLAAPALVHAAEPVQPVRALLVCGGCCHDYARQKDILCKGLAELAAIHVDVAFDPDKGTAHKNPVYDKPNWAKGYDVIIHDECSAAVKDLAVIDTILKPHREGLPAVVLHCGMHCYRSEGFPKAVTPWFELTGLQTTGHGAQQPIVVNYIDKESPITGSLEGWTTIKEELYNNITGKLLDTGHALARGKQTVKSKDGKETTNDYIVVWTNQYQGKTKVFATTLGHNNETVADSRYLQMVARGLLWSVGKLEPAYLKSAK